MEQKIILKFCETITLNIADDRQSGYFLWNYLCFLFSKWEGVA
jgi:hypothetical protein